LLRSINIFLILIACDVEFRNMMKLFVQSGTNMMELYELIPKHNMSNHYTKLSAGFSTQGDEVLATCTSDSECYKYFLQTWTNSLYFIFRLIISIRFILG